MGSSLARVPEPAIMAADEEGEYIRCNSVLVDRHPLVIGFSELCPGFPGGPARILDVGCGIANMAAQFCKAFPEAKAVGVDASPNMLRFAGAVVRFLGLEDRISLRQAWLPDGDFGEPEKSFDLVFARSSLHHFADPLDFWRAVSRYAKEDAAVFIVDILRPPTFARLQELVWERFGDAQTPMRRAFLASLLASHTIEEIGCQLAKAGLNDVSLMGTNLGPSPSSRDETHVVAWRPGRFERGNE